MHNYKLSIDNSVLIYKYQSSQIVATFLQLIKSTLCLVGRGEGRVGGNVRRDS